MGDNPGAHGAVGVLVGFGDADQMLRHVGHWIPHVDMIDA